MPPQLRDRAKIRRAKVGNAKLFYWKTASAEVTARCVLIQPARQALPRAGKQIFWQNLTPLAR
jgi:hypothetical protein